MGTQTEAYKPFMRICQDPDGPDLLVPQTYAGWRYCVECRGIAITASYLHERLTTLSDGTHPVTELLAASFGHDHIARLLSWITKARAELLC